MTRAARGKALVWFKSSHSSSQGGDCLEVAYDWHKSSYSGSEGGACVEVSSHPTAVHIRDSKVTDGPVLTVPPAAWAAFVDETGQR
ncbi:DUF397 domain-containing protein [Streptomyces sp. NBC_00059]|uniref:DUF397 domain-containing protein n=1 Tax=Streptomyces sp. NBC_00059 TaxID=2975635 RepID=UPI0022502394|nr:DUF397 domain-containing protein [Streptomyces sp. NBC_00059]MCX5416853.1 DUF397 domain-containing protein [Streptomyces sp. NBC_00059]